MTTTTKNPTRPAVPPSDEQGTLTVTRNEARLLAVMLDRRLNRFDRKGMADPDRPAALALRRKLRDVPGGHI